MTTKNRNGVIEKILTKYGFKPMDKTIRLMLEECSLSKEKEMLDKFKKMIDELSEDVDDGYHPIEKYVHAEELKQKLEGLK